MNLKKYFQKLNERKKKTLEEVKNNGDLISIEQKSQRGKNTEMVRKT